jgi:predicted Zn finger-like uncharacterized protein
VKTRCPGCQTTFRVTPEQLKVRAGKVRCGKCQAVFNALDSLVEESDPSLVSQPPAMSPHVDAPAIADIAINEVDILLEAPAEPEPALPPATETQEPVTPVGEPLSEAEAQELAKSSGLIVPRETTEIPGYSKWAEGVMSSPASHSPGRNTSWPFTMAALLLVLALAGQLVFHFRSEIAVAAPSLRPALEALSEALGSGIPLPRHAELVSIETSDLQADPSRSNLLVLQATLRNRAAYGQAYPLLELSLTDTQDNAIARRVFPPDEYLSSKNPADQPFPANADIAVRLWIETKDISAAGYRLYVFYP